MGPEELPHAYRRSQSKRLKRIHFLAALTAVAFPACGGGIPLRDQASAGKILALFTLIVMILLIGLYGTRPHD